MKYNLSQVPEEMVHLFIPEKRQERAQQKIKALEQDLDSAG